jgi:hypothetical protein
MKPATCVFLALLFYAHTAGASDEILGQPLSVFRDGAGGLLGYTLFTSLLVVGGFMIAALARLRRPLDVGVFGLAALLLVVVAATPSLGSFHLFCSLLLLLLLYCYYGLLLRLAETWWLIPHLLVPFALLLATQCHSFGAWQKSLILYFVLAVNVHFHLLCGWPGGRPAPAAARASRRASPLRRKVVFQLNPGGNCWARRK